MPKPFFERLRIYYNSVAAVLRGEADAASVFPNSTDVGMKRENAYVAFLQQHVPSKCNVFLGGFVFGMDGTESGQLDVIITTDTAPRFDFNNSAGTGKSFACVEGTLAVASVKSTLNKTELEDSLAGMARIPKTKPLTGRKTLGMDIPRYDDWPYKIVFASDGINGPTILSHLEAYYEANPEIPESRRPHVIHVAGKYVILRIVPGLVVVDDANTITTPTLGTFRLFTREPDLQAIAWVLNALQQHAVASTHIISTYGDLINKINGHTADELTICATHGDPKHE